MNTVLIQEDTDNTDMDFLKKNDRIIDISKLPPKVREQIEKLAFVDILKDQAKEKLKAEQINIEDYLKQFIAGLSSNATKETYSRAIKDFMAYAETNGAEHPLMIKAELVDGYITYLKESYTNNTIRLKLSAVSSFYSKLKRYKLISDNPFLGATLPKKEYKKAVKLDGTKTIPVMNNQDLKAINEATKSKGWVSLAIHFMATYGLRIGALPTIKIHDGFFTYTTKGGKGGRHTIEPSTTKLLDNKTPFKTLSIGSLKVTIKRVTTKLFNEDKISHAYSCHDFRHLYAVNHYKKHKDIYQLRELLNHASINITEIYLQSLSLGDIYNSKN